LHRSLQNGNQFRCLSAAGRSSTDFLQIGQRMALFLGIGLALAYRIAGRGLGFRLGAGG
jgi:hypothetical protein